MTTEATTEQLEMNFDTPELKPIQEILQQALWEDDDWRIKYTHSVICNYLRLHKEGNTDNPQLDLVEDIFAGFCGWSLSTLIIACLDDTKPNDVDMMMNERPAYIRRRYAAAPGGCTIKS
jgi:hypothetical protein